jgi:hypothetical protein
MTDGYTFVLILNYYIALVINIIGVIACATYQFICATIAIQVIVNHHNLLLMLLTLVAYTANSQLIHKAF